MFLDAGDGTEDIPVGLVTPEMFSLFRVNPILGRTFTNEETLPGEPSRVAVLSYSMWQNQFGSDPNVIGRTIQLSGAPHTDYRRDAGGLLISRTRRSSGGLCPLIQNNWIADLTICAWWAA